MRRSTLYILSLLCPVLLTALGGCSTAKNTASSRRWQEFTTRYNVYYNGAEHYKEQLKAQEQGFKDDYTRTLFMHPAEAHALTRGDKPAGDFKRTIEKMQKAIQLHSITKKPLKRTSTPKDKAFRAREEFNPFLHNAWLMMGRAQYFGGDFAGAASTFFYISRHFRWLPQVVDEAKLWQARSYLALDWLYEAENILTHIHRDKLASKSLQALYDFDMADYYIRSHRFSEAVEPLTRAARAESGVMRSRLYYLLGQTYAQLGNKRQAYKAYAQAASGSGTDYRLKFNARIAQSEVFEGSNIKGEVAALRRMTRYERNSPYLDQIFYAIGNLYLTHRDTVRAVESYTQAIAKSAEGGITKALPQLALGQIYFDRHDYVKAQPLYSEALPQLSDTYPGYKTLKLRSDVLDELATFSGNVQLQDSLLALSKLPEEEQMKVCRRLADEYVKKKKEEAEEARRQEALAEANARGDQNQAGKDNAPTQFSLNNDKSWYFYNTQAKSQGKAEFQRRWGARRLEDDWRRRNKASFSMDSDTDEDEDTSPDALPNDSVTEQDRQAIADAANPEKPQYYLKDIPSTPEQIATCTDIIQDGLYNMALILKDKLEDYAQARALFDELDTRFPDNVFRLDAYYNLYLMAVRQDLSSQAEHYRNLIVTDFASSPYGQAMADPDYFRNLQRMDTLQEELYEKAYTAYLSDDNSTVHSLAAQMEKDFPLSPLMPRFIFIDALSYVTDRDEERFAERLGELLDRYPQADMNTMASDMLKYLKAGRHLNTAGSNSRPMLWQTRLTADQGENALSSSTPARFDTDPDKPQYLVLAFPLDSVSPNTLLFQIARHNFSTFTVRDFDLEQMNFGQIGLLIVKGFDNQKQLDHYRTILARDADMVLPPEVRPINISKANFELLLSEGRSFEEYFDFLEHKDEHIHDDLEAPGPSSEGKEDDAPQDTGPDETPRQTDPIPPTESTLPPPSPQIQQNEPEIIE